MRLLAPIDPAGHSNPHTFFSQLLLTLLALYPIYLQLIIPTNMLNITVVLIGLHLSTSNTINTLGTCRVANKYSAEHRGHAQVSPAFLWSTYLIILFSDRFFMDDTHCHGCWPARMTDRVSLRPPCARHGWAASPLLRGKTLTLPKPYRASRLTTPECRKMTGRSKLSHFSKENKDLSSFWLTLPGKNNKNYLPSCEKLTGFPFFFWWTCCATSAVRYEVL